MDSPRNGHNAKENDVPKYYEFRVALKDIRPPIWRRFLLTTKATFEDLHHAIQDAFGWERSHLWEFREKNYHGRPIAGLPTEYGWGPPVPDGRRMKLLKYFSENAPGTKCIYIYDFGDDWIHTVTMRKVVMDDAKFVRRLLAGRRACPPEDCGGIPGYERMVTFVQTGEDIWGDDPADLAEWLGGWQPDNFDVKAQKKWFDK